jgi:zeaxanthin epoxidase
MAARGGSGAASSSSAPLPFDASRVRREYESRRIVRAGAIHGMARAAAVMASTYKAHLGEGLGPAGEWAAQRLRIPHPGRVAGQAVLSLTMPLVLEWVLGGNCAALERARVPKCRLTDTPRGFSARELREELLRDDKALLRRAKARWLLLAERAPTGAGADPTSTTEVKGVMIDGEGAVIGRSADAAAAAIGGLPPVAAAVGEAEAGEAAADAASSSSSSSPAAALSVDDASVAPNHARVWRDPATGDHLLQDLGSPSGTYVNGRRMPDGGRVALKPGDVVEFGRSPSAEPFRVRLQHESLCDQGVSGRRYTTMVIGARRADAGTGEDVDAVARLEAERGARAVAEAAERVRASSR